MSSLTAGGVTEYGFADDASKVSTNQAPRHGCANRSRRTSAQAARRRTRCSTPGCRSSSSRRVATRAGRSARPPLMRVEHDGEYALVASYGGRPDHPVWYHNLKADPQAVTVQDGPEPFAGRGHRARRRGASVVVGAGRGRVSAVRRVPGQDRPPDPRLQGDDPPSTDRVPRVAPGIRCNARCVPRL